MYGRRYGRHYPTIEEGLKMRWIIVSLCILLVWYNLVDVIQTKMLMDLGVGEGNPMLLYLINLTGYWEVIIVVKGFLLLMLFTGIYLKVRRL